VFLLEVKEMGFSVGNFEDSLGLCWDGVSVDLHSLLFFFSKYSLP
jgi:hypothetical protein